MVRVELPAMRDGPTKKAACDLHPMAKERLLLDLDRKRTLLIAHPSQDSRPNHIAVVSRLTASVTITVHESIRSASPKSFVSRLDLIVQRSSDQLPQAENTVLHVFCGRPTRVQADIRV
jgi:hypothetical protein